MVVDDEEVKERNTWSRYEYHQDTTGTPTHPPSGGRLSRSFLTLPSQNSERRRVVPPLDPPGPVGKGGGSQKN